MRENHPHPQLGDENDEVLWGAKAIAAAIDRDVRQTFHMLGNGYLPANKVGRIWVSTRNRLRRVVSLASQTATLSSMPSFRKPRRQ